MRFDESLPNCVRGSVCVCARARVVGSAFVSDCDKQRSPAVPHCVRSDTLLIRQRLE